MKHLKLFETTAAFDAAKDNIEKPYVALIEDDSKVHYKDVPHYEMVDLGLPSGLKWAKCNIGAEKETDYGLYFQWGATEGYTAEQVAKREKVFYFDTTPYQTNGSAGTTYSATKWTKYLGSTTSTYKDPSATDEDALKTVLDPEDDAATKIMGKGWSIPTKADYDELFVNTTKEWVTNYNDSGVNGRLFTSKTNGNTLFIPAAGCIQGTFVTDVGSSGYVCSSSLYASRPYNAQNLVFSSSICTTNLMARYFGFSLRGVHS